MSAVAVELVGRLLRHLASIQHPYLCWDAEWATVVALTDEWLDQRGRPFLVRLGEDGRADLSAAVTGIAEGADAIAWIESVEVPLVEDGLKANVVQVIAFDLTEAHAWYCVLGPRDEGAAVRGEWQAANWIVSTRASVIASARSLMTAS